MITIFYALFVDNRLQNLQDVTSVAAGGQLKMQSIKYCTKVGKTGPTRQRDAPNFIATSLPIQSYQIWRHQLLLVGIYRSLIKRPKCRLRRLWVEFYWRGVLPGSTNWWASCYSSPRWRMFHQKSGKFITCVNRVMSRKKNLVFLQPTVAFRQVGDVRKFFPKKRCSLIDNWIA